MIIRPQSNWLRMLLVWHGSVLPAILPQLLLILAISLAAVFGHGRIFGERVPLDTAPFPLLGVSLAIFLAFRNNASYQRYLEARQLWGHMLIASRSLTSQALAYLPARRVGRRELASRVIAFVHLLRHQLRGSSPDADLARLLPPALAAELRQRAYRPVAVLNGLRRLMRQTAPDSQTLWMLDGQINSLADAVGGCERLASTPIPYPYGVLLHRTIYAYCFLLPFGLVHAIGAATPLISVFVAYTLFALEAIAQEIADPFGTAPNSLALEAICRTIERSVLELCDLPMPDEASADKNFRMD
ncbi:bestrophin family protein [Massilia sp. YIM B04103]|uniref:bestrophin family protein n=1 Tax=Massilia sp. YIM B04103 TaxID=2963106 RepID=UPI002109A19A|nr:bestrophin family ion channel [Massilia sp. YIM B04103]